MLKPMNRFLYSVLFHLALPLIAVRLWLRGRNAPAYRQRLAERFAWRLPAMQTGGIWLHCVSVGETIAAVPLVRALQRQYPDLPITLTGMTPTGSERIRALFGDSVQHCYLPYDLPWAAARFLTHLKPRLAIIMETELWPNYMHACAQRHIPTVLANARLSARSARGYARFARLTRPMLASMHVIAAQTAVEAERFLALGARETAVVITGSIKFDIDIPDDLRTRAHALRTAWAAQQRPIWIAASTHAGEDEHLLTAHRQLLKKQPDALLILVPRHPERFNSVYTLCNSAGFNTVRRSSGDFIQAQHNVLLGDSMGELLFLYALADVAFVGGSLVERGGHNLLEPAALGLPLLSGPHVFNFLDIATRLQEQGALHYAEDASQLAAHLQELFENALLRQEMGAHALTTIRANQGALARLLSAINTTLENH